MSERRKQLWASYCWSLGIAGVISLIGFPTLVQAGGWGNGILMSAVATLAFGSAFFLLGAFREIVRLPTFLVNLAAQTVLLAVTLIVPTILVAWITVSTQAKVSPFNADVVRAVFNLHNVTDPFAKLETMSGQRILSLNGVAVLAFGALLSLVINTGFQITRKIGPGMFANWVTGRYYTPREEERIFMFLDMKDSTAIAERIGNLKYSALVRDFFRDLTYPVLETKGEVSHFIGDEAVLTWKPANGLDKGNCVQCFFKMRAAISDRAVYYREQYGFVPEFKAGLHVGPVVATEVGEIKSEIVFHGDVLNTAARIQALCNAEGEPLLLSGELADRLATPAGFALRRIGTRTLKGKAHDVEIATVEPTSISA